MVFKCDRRTASGRSPKPGPPRRFGSRFPVSPAATRSGPLILGTMVSTSYTCLAVIDDYLDLKLAEFLERAASEQAPGAGSVAAVAIALAASLVAKVARRSRDSWTDGAGVAAQALELRSRCPSLARDDADAWQQALAALGSARGRHG